MFSPEEGRAVGMHLDQRALAVFEVVLDMLGRGQAAGTIRKRPVRGRRPPHGCSFTAPPFSRSMDFWCQKRSDRRRWRQPLPLWWTAGNPQPDT
ncbi:MULTISPECIES: hypothetical protein [unclassified Rhizobium]|uniref:hypothetical protein n=1 Tax=unclassified Rhizobium TaxID=2613769 RepID=UPI001FD9E5A1|nr:MULTISPECIES: hypothetical protein [unclassified Rhizobium]